jgi:hypothetical protein
MSRYPKGYKKGDDIMPDAKPINPADAIPDAILSMGIGRKPETLHPDFVVIRDANGRWVPVSVKAFMEAMQNTCILFDMPFTAILEMRNIYRERGGELPITAESAREVMG